MTRPCITFALLMLASPALAQSGPTIDDFTVSGIHVIHKPIAANDVIAVQLFIKGGAAAVTAANAGIEQLIVDAAPLGTGKYTKAQFSTQSTKIGAEISGFAATEYTAMTLRAVRQNWDASWDLFADAVAHPTFPEAEVTVARGQLVNVVKQRTDNPDAYLNLVSDSLLYAGHPFAPDPRGTSRSVAALTSSDLARWHKRRFTQANLLIVVVGNVARNDLVTKIASAFGALPASGGSAPHIPALAVAKPSVTIVERSLPTNYILGAYVAPASASRDAAAVRLATRLLNDRLFEEVRTKRNLTYAVGSSFRAGTVGRGALYVTATQPDTTLKVMLTEVRRLQREPVSVERLQETRNEYVTNYWMSQETNLGQAAQLGAYELTGGGWRNALTLVDKMRAVTPADIHRVARRYLKNARFVVVGDPKKIDRALFSSL
ncbi:MAG: pitrilysin family protein [Gemmatimonadaceae bacterium]